MTEQFTQNLIDLGNRGLSPNRTPELGLYHREGTLHIRPLVVVLQKGFPIEVEIVPHPVPQAVIGSGGASHTSGVALEGNVSRTAYRLDGVKVLTAGISLVRRHLVDVECLGGLVQQGDKLGRIARLKRCSFNTSDDVGFNPAHQVGFHPSLSGAVAVLVVVPPVIDAGSEAGGINGKVRFNRSQWAGALLYEAFQQRRQFGAFQIAECAVIVCGFANQSAFLSLFQLAGKSPTGHSCIRLEHKPEHDISQRQAGAAKTVFRLLNAVAEVSEQDNKMFLFMGLSLIVGWPFLGAGHFERLGVGGSAVWLGFPLNYKLYCVYMLAWQSPLFKVGAGAKRLVVVETNEVSPVPRLGRDFPAQPVLFNLARVRYHQSFCFSLVHFNSLLNSFCIYNSIHCMYLSIPFSLILMEIIKKFPYFLLTIAHNV
jgi:hypothetical protein